MRHALKVLTSSQASKFHVGDKVYFNSSGGSREGGPFIIASVPSAGRYTLSLENGQAVRHGEEVEESRLEAA